jgi:hypothetical protein
VKSQKAPPSRAKHNHRPAQKPPVPVIGLEAEFTLLVDGNPRRPEMIFRDPRDFVRASMLPRTGKSYQLPTGGAVYFDTGVIEVATPIIEVGPGCCLRAVHSLWEQIHYIRGELDVLEKAGGKRMDLCGFSAHYNVSFPAEYENESRNVESLALLLCHLLPLPTMLLAANRQSTGVGVRPREGRIEITVDFTPDPELMAAAVSTAIGISHEVMAWKIYDLGQLAERGLPVIEGYKPRKHTSRKGWLARLECYPRNPFTADVNEADWLFRDGKMRSLRAAAHEIAEPFASRIEMMSDATTAEHAFAVLHGRARSLLDFEHRPPGYENVARERTWNRRSGRKLPLSNYERVIEQIVSKRPLWYKGIRYQPVQMVGWYEVAVREMRSGIRLVLTLDDLVSGG